MQNLASIRWTSSAACRQPIWKHRETAILPYKCFIFFTWKKVNFFPLSLSFYPFLRLLLQRLLLLLITYSKRVAAMLARLRLRSNSPHMSTRVLDRNTRKKGGTIFCISRARMRDFRFIHLFIYSFFHVLFRRCFSLPLCVFCFWLVHGNTIWAFGEWLFIYIYTEF